MQKTFRTLELAIQFYDLVRKLKLRAHHRDQLTRAASSIALNLSEGNAKLSIKDKARFYQISFGSLRECQTIFRLEVVSDQRLLGLADHLAACLYKLSRMNEGTTKAATQSPASWRMAPARTRRTRRAGGPCLIARVKKNREIAT